jgi:hypothetical protein
MTRVPRGLCTCVCLSFLVGTEIHAELARPRNPWLVAGESSMTHFEPAQQDSVAHAGPAGVGEVGWDRIQRIAGGLGNGVYVNGLPYPDAPGVEVVWIVNASRVAKVRVDGGRWEELARFALPGQPQIDAAEADRITAALDAAKSEEDLVAFIRSEYPYWLERVVARSGVYSMMDRDGHFYTFVRDRVLVLGDRDPRDPRSPIELKREWRVPPEVLSDFAIRWNVLRRIWNGDLTGRFTSPGRPTITQALEILRDTGLGLGMTWDGHVVLTTVSGAVAVIDRGFERPPQWLRFEGEMITNSFAVDERGGIYVVTDQNMHKLVWTGARLSRESADGAWSNPYEQAKAPLGGIRAGSKGSGATPTLMGFGPGEDPLVVITDGADVMNLVAYWRDAIPAGRNTRVAGSIPVTVGRPDATAVQSEQSVVVLGDGAFVVNNVGPDTLASAFENVVAIGVTRSPPRGVERFRWDAAGSRWERVWARADVASPSCVPVASAVSGQVYLQTAEDGRFEILGLDWATGATRTRLALPRTQAMNAAYMLLQFLPDGDVAMGMLTGAVRIDTSAASARE